LVSTAPGSCCVDPNPRRWKLRWRAASRATYIPLRTSARASERAPRRDDTAATFGALRIPGQEFDSLRMRRRANPPDAIDVPDTFVDEAIARGARPTVLPSAMPARARPPGPTPSMPFERMLQPEPATTGLVAGKSFPSVDPDCRGICNEMINSRPQWSRGFSTVKAPSAPSVDASSRPRPTGSVFSTESQTRNIRQPVLPISRNLRRAWRAMRRHPAAAKPVCKSAGLHGIIGDAMKSFLDVATCAPDDRAEPPTCRRSLPNRPTTTAPPGQPTGRSRPRCLACAGRGLPVGRLSDRAECQCVKVGAAV